MRQILGSATFAPPGTEVEALDVRGRLIVIKGPVDLNDSVAHMLATRLKKAGALELIFVPPDTSLEALSDGDLRKLGFCRLGAVKSEVTS